MSSEKSMAGLSLEQNIEQGKTKTSRVRYDDMRSSEARELAAIIKEIEADFSNKVAFAIEEKIFEGDWAFQLERWLPQLVDICCKYKGYKNTVKEKRVLFTGDIWPDDKYVILNDKTTHKDGEKV